jgi:membrane protein implicated in regulation of membrane protease activity
MAQRNPPDDDDDYELELEPVDPEILAKERARATHRTDTAASKIDVDELYGDTGGYSDLTVDLSQLKQFRFTTRHLLIATAFLAILLTLFRLFQTTRTIVIVAAVALSAGWIWALRLERKQELERERRRAEFFGEAVDAEPVDADLEPTVAPRPEFKFAFSIKEMLITTAVCAVVLTLLLFVGPAALSITLGGVALAGLIANALGYDPPPHVIFGWWLLLVMYLIVGVFALLGPEKSSVHRRDIEPSVSYAVLEWRPGCDGAAA